MLRNVTNIEESVPTSTPCRSCSLTNLMLARPLHMHLITKSRPVSTVHSHGLRTLSIRLRQPLVKQLAKCKCSGPSRVGQGQE